MSGAQKVVLALFVLAFVAMIYGVIPWEDLGIGLPTLWWWFPGDDRVVPAVRDPDRGRQPHVGGLVHLDVRRRRPGLLGVALIIGIARGITVIMNNGLITDTVLNAAEQAVAGLGGVAFINLMYFLFLPLSFLIPSSSGLATVAMPIMAPGELRRGARPACRDRLSERERAGQPRDPDFRRRHGRPRDRPSRYGTWLRFVWPVLICWPY